MFKKLGDWFTNVLVGAVVIFVCLNCIIFVINVFGDWTNTADWESRFSYLNNKNQKVYLGTVKFLNDRDRCKVVSDYVYSLLLEGKDTILYFGEDIKVEYMSMKAITYTCIRPSDIEYLWS